MRGAAAERRLTVPVWRHARAILLLPGVVTIAVPLALLAPAGSVRVGWGLPGPWRVLPVALGLVLLVAGLALWARTVALLARVGEGTLAPWDPTRRLVVRGIYRHVRNPMISAVLAVLLGEAALVGSWPLLGCFLAFLVLGALYVPRGEERGLVRRFGGEYLRYAHHVPRWVPRLRPWGPGAEEPRARRPAPR